MRRPLKVAILGCGTAGLAAAAFLARDGHDIQIFERFSEPRPLGAGLLLQPTGLACLACLGLDLKAIEYGAEINSIYGRTASGRVIFDISYRSLRPHYFGLGIHRGTLFGILYDEVVRLNVPIRTGCTVIDTRLESAQRILIDSNDREHGAFDLLIDASGMRSPLRKNGLVRLDKPYPFGAIWGVVDDPGQAFGKDYLQQRYDGARIMIGMLAIGKEPGGNEAKCTFFWSLPGGGYDAWLDSGLAAWKEQVCRYWPALEPFLAQFKTTDGLAFAEYSDIIMKRWHEDGLVFIGDAAHNTSPQLGQGANLALADALVLSSVLKEYGTLHEALAAYTRARMSQVNFYQIASRWLTPFFQSHSRPAGWVRDMTFGSLCKTPYAKTEMLKTLAGLKTGIFSSMDPGRWHERYSWKGPEASS